LDAIRGSMGKDDLLNSEEGAEKLPNQKELEKELSDYLSKKYGNRIKIISPFYLSETAGHWTDEAKSGEGKGREVKFDMLP
jgi:ATP-dependent Clp protease ATP-binding subunit ClpX